MSSSNTTAIHPPWSYDSLQSQAAVYDFWTYQLVILMTLGGYMWDSIISFHSDCEFIVRRRFNLVSFLFILNRLVGILAFVTGALQVSSTIVPCSAISVVSVAADGVLQLTSSALLYLRVKALYKEIYVWVFMFALMIPGPVLSMIAWIPEPVIKYPGINGGCDYRDKAHWWAYISCVLQAIFDLMVFLLCTVKLIYATGFSFRSLGFRTKEPRTRMKITEAFSRGAFIYYIPTVLVQVITLIFIFLHLSPSRIIISYTADGVASAQALRITRQLWKDARRKDRHVVLPVSTTDIITTPAQGLTRQSRTTITR